MNSAKYRPIEWDDDQKYCILACLDVVRGDCDSYDKAEVEGCIEWIKQIMEPLEYARGLNDAPFLEKRKISYLEQLLSILEFMELVTSIIIILHHTDKNFTIPPSVRRLSIKRILFYKYFAQSSNNNLVDALENFNIFRGIITIARNNFIPSLFTALVKGYFILNRIFDDNFKDKPELKDNLK
ncbi:hypothetical protein PIROE2DRAFT_17709 [Piromyces sp. E2]|nr:hypothetical protein PIROE2DRAFT_17709 [Piromyces sp. E2]|eukprot:OUM57341.1 hypothetical protein PIROE2DRAFT_17709 [Piromyces sp. E2]